MNKLLLCLLSLNFLTISCADNNDKPLDANGVAQLENDFIAFISSLVHQRPEITGIDALITHLLNMGFDSDSPAIEMLEDIQHDQEQRKIGQILISSESATFKVQFLQKIMNLYVKIGFISQKADFSEDTKAQLIKDEIQEWLDCCLPGLKLPENHEIFELKEFLRINKSVAVPDYKIRIYALVDTLVSLNPNLSSISA